MYFKILNILIIFIAIFLTIEGFPIRRIKVNNDIKIKSEIRETPNEGDDESSRLFELLEIFDEPLTKPGYYREKTGWEKLIPHKPILAEVMVLSVLIVAGFIAVGMLAVGIAWIIATNKWLEVQEDIFDGTKVLRFPGAEDQLRGMHFPSGKIMKRFLQKDTFLALKTVLDIRAVRFLDHCGASSFSVCRSIKCSFHCRIFSTYRD
ncbi:uncharacterized protein LOC121394609 [Xenopus laevis]|uniref:Uncharacterized protein LOC121394609 n=1 Tax=Xenopus laevis TaxID=8355 RepID=A0A8J1L0B2_XENLA|nr:uncharacterized protein LOC121394609 [Xenopus laevis]